MTTVKIERAFIHLRSHIHVPEWSRSLDIRPSNLCSGVSIVRVQIPSRENKKCVGPKIEFRNCWVEYSEIYKYLVLTLYICISGNFEIK